MALNGCVVSEQKEARTSVLQASNRNDEPAPQARIIMLQPERNIQNGVNDLYILSPQRMKGLFAEEVEKMFGVPDFKHYDKPAEIWQYRKKECLLDIFLYIDKHQSNNLRVRHAEVRGRSISKISQKNCLLQALRVRR
jgi:hypothetical protein